jgi:AAA+ ATPase superfamily predicted ATPase
MFWDRKRELSFLERQYEQPDAGLTVIYGRRRVGKTALLRQFLAGKPGLYFLADQQLEAEQRRRFQELMASAFDDPLAAQIDFRNWDSLFAYLGQRFSPDRKLVLVLDEFQYLARSNPAFPSILQRLWDEQWREKNVLLLLCGSLVGMMYETTLSYESPLYGRRTGQIRLRPLTFSDYAEVFPDRSFNERVELYSVTGGVPRYIEAFATGRSFSEIVGAEIFDRNGLLYDEPRFVLNEEISEAATYFSILRAIAHGEHKIGKIGGLLQVDSTRLSRYLRTLVDLDILEHRVPVTEAQPEKSKRGLYFISDQFFRFWFHYVFPNRSYLEGGNAEIAQQKLEGTFPAFVSLAFEQCCRESLWSLSLEGQLPFALERVGAWWNKDQEIDIVGINETTGDILLAECKWTERQVGIGVLAELRAKATAVDWRAGLRRERYAIFSRSGFDAELTHAAGRGEVLLFSNGVRVE